jgi:ribosomal protein L11 methyltransferase
MARSRPAARISTTWNDVSVSNRSLQVSRARWQQLTLTLDAARIPKAEALLQLAGAQALSFDDAEDDPVLEPLPGQTPLWPRVSLRALFPMDLDLGPLCRVLTDACAPRALRTAPLEDSQWQKTSRPIPPRRIGTRLWLSSADHTSENAAAESTQVKLHMGLAFGTGEHPTTALCLEWLDTNVRPGARVLDYGCGSGILAIAALALGADRAWAVDNDPQALTATLANAELNGVSHRLMVGLPAELPPLAVDVIVANILAGPLELLAPTLIGYLAAHGAVVLSGILEHQRAAVQTAYAPYFVSFSSIERDGWVRIEARR